MTVKKLLLTFGLILALSALPAFAKPNFTGEWKLSISKSDFGGMPSPSSLTSKVAHDDPKMKVNVKQSGDMGEFEMESNYTTDGKECTNEIFGSPYTSVVKWDGDTLLIDSKGKMGDSDFSISDKWNISGDGKTFTINRVFKSGMGDAVQKMVMEK